MLCDHLPARNSLGWVTAEPRDIGSNYFPHIPAAAAKRPEMADLFLADLFWGGPIPQWESFWGENIFGTRIRPRTHSEPILEKFFSAGSGSAGSGSAGSGPAGSGPAGSGPAGSSPAQAIKPNPTGPKKVCQKKVCHFQVSRKKAEKCHFPEPKSVCSNEFALKGFGNVRPGPGPKSRVGGPQ